MTGIDEPSYLSLFITDPVSGRPTSGLPVYAELIVPFTPAARAPSRRLREPVFSAVTNFDDSIPEAERARIVDMILAALASILTEEAELSLAADPNEARELVYAVLKRVFDTAGVDSLQDITQAKLSVLIKQGMKDVAEEHDLELAAEAEPQEVVYAEPLGILTTDHVGYLSFDLMRLQPQSRLMLSLAMAERRADKNAPQKVQILVQPFGQEAAVDVFGQARFAANAIVGRVMAPKADLPAALVNMGGRALQNPGLTDWQLSPASFAASPKSLLGEDGCEQLLPANLALQEFMLRQVVRVADPPAGQNLPADTRFAYVDDYKVSWFSIGHSLGEILYSLPLAPAETVKLAVIDWSWDSLTERQEDTKLTENLLHQTHRDRLISEVVKAGVKELQHGSSFMAGTANSVGGSFGANLGIVGVGAAAGNTMALGGSTASSEGSRDLAADNVQRINDSFSQASSAVRELTSTVVIQARQEEKESIQTRTFTNYNHSHTLTILYYQVLRHYRVTVEWMRRRAAVLAKIPARIATFDAKTLLAYRSVLEANLLDASLKPGFDALAKQESLRDYQTTQNIVPGNVWTFPPWEGDEEFTTFEIGIKTTESDLSDSTIVIYVITSDEWVQEKRHELHYVYRGGHMGEGENQFHNVNSGERFGEKGSVQWTFCKIFDQITGKGTTVKWKDIIGFQFEKWGDDDWRIDALCINAFGQNGICRWLTSPEGLRDVDLYFRGEEPSSQSFTWLNRPGPRPAGLPPVVGPEQSLTLEELGAAKRLSNHFEKNNAYYNRVIALTTDESELAIQFEGKAWTTPGQNMADHADPTPLELFGSYVAYPLARPADAANDALYVDLAAAINSGDPARQKWVQDKLAAMNEDDRAKALEGIALASAKSERLITLPTRGVFAEGKLGHCNISEEIDNTRFWKWEEHPIPIEAPEIGTVTPVQPTPQAVNPTPTPFPQSLINIVTPSPVPDPTGLGAALNLLATPNLFRDMSGRQEVADLLKKLSDNSISIAEAANKAREIQAKYGTDLDKQQKDYDLGVTKAAAETEGKAIEADAQVQMAKAKSADAQAAKDEAEAKKATVEAASKQADAAKDVPKAYRAPIYADSAATLAGNPTKTKVVVFKTKAFDGQDIPGEFSLYVHEVGNMPIINGDKVVSYGAKSVTFSTATPVINARAIRAAFNLKFGDIDLSMPAISITNEGNSYEVGKSHKTVDLLLKQDAMAVSFKAKSTNGAVDELMNKWGVELGVDKTVAAKIVADYEKKNKIEHTTEEEKSYSFNVPTQTYKLSITSH
ncbi:hypothetical protein FHX08_000733 [Rhizobium sp. BK529]|uniref:hypothetical protein n=1 Tax=unclassified Rhizobium TaxID=2613769 RepID=UPI001052D958|nr:MULTISPECIES: hypothetical protein [unclassified Rhizobium]MBB3590389.1 hypothetical protein [Rhizobium sp. BK529]TCS05081.1 hypothetical protein EV281_103763 [Rhizobium sp. BK418]